MLPTRFATDYYGAPLLWSETEDWRTYVVYPFGTDWYHSFEELAPHWHKDR